MDKAATDSELLEHIIRTIVEHFNPRRIVLFGSRSRGDFHADSDFDIMVEMESDLQPVERAIAIGKLFGLRVWAMDVIVYTPEEVRRFRNVFGSFVSMIEEDGRVVYERQ